MIQPTCVPPPAQDIGQPADDLLVEGSRGQAALDRRPPPAIAKARQRPAGLGARPSGILRIEPVASGAIFLVSSSTGRERR